MLKKGFTLIEMLTVVLIIGILTAVAVPQYRRVIAKAHVSEAEAVLRTIYDSSERLAGDFGYRSYEKLIDVKGETNYSFKRMDMFDTASLPSQCSLVSGGTKLQCARFSYKAAVNGYVAAKKLNTPYQGTYILLDRNTMQLSCKGDEDACDVLGLDVNNEAEVSF